MKMKLFGLLIGGLLLLSPALMGQGTPYAATAAPGESSPVCGSVWKVTTFEADGVWTVPTGVDVVWVTGVGGGGGGASSSHRVPISVGGLTSVNIVIGIGGPQNRSGGNTLFGEFVVGRGGRAGGSASGGANGAGFKGNSIEGSMFASGGGGGTGYNRVQSRIRSAGNASGGSGGRAGYLGGGGGGASAFGSGGSGGGTYGSSGQGFGAGGGGGNKGYSGGWGSKGYLIIEWSAP